MKSVPPTEETDFKATTEVTTPETNPHYEVKISEMAKARVQKADPNEGRCMVWNTKFSVQYCHCIQRRVMRNSNELEWYWNMKHSSLNLDSHYNIFRLESHMHDHFDRDGWLLLPEPDVLHLFTSTLETIGHQAFAIREYFPNFDKDETFCYRFVLLKGWEEEIIFRRNGTSTDAYPHPFKELPYLKSHIRPQFAIYNAGLKLTKLSRSLKDIKALIDTFPDLTSVMDLYTAWNRELPENHTENPSYLPHNPPGPSHDKADVSDDDLVDLVDNEEEDPDYEDHSDKKRKRKAAQEVPPKRPKRKREQKVSAPSRHQLPSKITLSRLEQLGQVGWTCNSIRKWSNPPRIWRGSSNRKAQPAYSSALLC